MGHYDHCREADAERRIADRRLANENRLRGIPVKEPTIADNLNSLYEALTRPRDQRPERLDSTKNKPADPAP